MRAERFVLLLGLIFPCLFSAAQSTERDRVNEVLKQRGEAKIMVKAASCDLQRIAEVASLDYRREEGWLVYVNERTFDEFCALGLDYTLFETPQTKVQGMATTREQMQFWNAYPTFEVYCDMMCFYAGQYPDLCRLDTVGESVMGKKILSIRLTDNTDEAIGKPKFFFSSSIHGDELTGMVMLLRLADSLLTNYQTDETIRRLLSSIELFICPLANTDGAYRGGNNSVWSATRFNANFVDLNRNFPDPVRGENSDGVTYQCETSAFMDYAKRERFDLAANLHGGAEVCNYPWDCWSSNAQSHADKAWFEEVCSEFVDKVRANSPSHYFTDVSQNGVTNGGDWYVVHGGRQDYHTFFLACREITLEISSDKTPPASSLPLYWSYLAEALTTLADRTTKGVNGVVKDSVSGMELDSVKVELLNSTGNASEVYSKQRGYYFRGLSAGVYELKFSKNGYEDKIVSLTAQPDSLIRLDVKLKKSDVSLSRNLETGGEINIYPNPCSERLFILSDCRGEYELTGSLGIVLQRGRIERGENIIDVAQLSNGVYGLKIYPADQAESQRVVKIIKQ